jgi:hypothetical protein
MSKDALGGADKVIATVGVSGTGDHDGGGVGESALLGRGGPPHDTRALEMKEQDNAAKEALATPAFPHLVPCPGGRTGRTVLGPLGIPGDDGGGPARGVDAGHTGVPPIGGGEAHDAGPAVVARDDGGAKRRGEGGSVASGGGATEERRPARATTPDGMDAEAPEQGAHVMRGGVAVGGIRIVRAPGEDGSAVAAAVTPPPDPRGDGRPPRAAAEQRVGGSAQGLVALALRGGTGHPRTTTLVGGPAAGHRARARP